ncbi:MAG: hypothetical protein V3V40_06065 [Nitrosomonadaceae bacterium]
MGHAAGIAKTKYLEESGFTDGQLRGWIERYLKKGIHYQTFGRTTVIFIEEMDKWLRNGGPQASSPTEMGSASGSGEGANSSIRKPSRAIHISKLTLPQRPGAETT